MKVKARVAEYGNDFPDYELIINAAMTYERDMRSRQSVWLILIR